MTLLFWDSFDHYNSSYVTRKWGYWAGGLGGSVGTQTGRHGSKAMAISYSTQIRSEIIVPGDDKAYIGFAAKRTGFGPGGFNIQLYSSDLIRHIYLQNDSPTHMWVLKDSGSNILQWSTYETQIGVWDYVELYTQINNSGVCEVWVNSKKIIDYSGDTYNSGTANVGQIRILGGGSGDGTHVDDLYWADGTNSQTLLGDIRIDCLFPTGAGSSTDMTPSAGNNWECVDEAVVNDETDYVSEDTVGDHDSYQFADLPTSTGSVYGVQLVSDMQKADAGSASAKHVVRSGGTDYTPGSEHTLGEGYSFYSDLLLTDPDTSSAWTISGVNSAEFGVKKET